MNTFSIKLFFSEVCIAILIYMISFAIFEIKQKNNKPGGIVTIIFSIVSIVLSVIVFWVN